MAAPQVTPITESRHAQGFIVSDHDPLVTREQGTLVSGQKLTAGTVLGTVLGSTAVAAALRTNSGNGTFGTIAVLPPAVEGRYQLVMETATTFVVTDPGGNELPHGSTGAAYAEGGLGFTLTAGTDAFVQGDAFDITVSTTGAGYAAYDPTLDNGQEIATAILLNDTDATSAAHPCGVIARGPIAVNASELIWGANVTTAEQQNAALTALAGHGIVAR